MARFFTDLRFALRLWGKNPGFVIAAVLTLALGIALNTITFGFVNALYFRPMSVREDSRVAVFVERHPSQGGRFQVSYPNFRDWRGGSQSFEAMASLEERPVNFSSLTGGAKEPELAGGALVTPSAFELLGIRPLIGRPLSPGEGGSLEILISERLWKRQFDRDPAVIGREVLVDGERAAIVGVLPYQFRFIYGGYDVVRRLDPSSRLQDRGARTVQAIGRLKSGVAMAEARAEMEMLGRHLSEAYPATNRDWKVDVVPYREFVFSSAKRIYPLLLGASTFLLLIVFANVSNLLLAKASARRREIAVRLALGCSRGGIVRQLISEGTFLAMAGGGAGLLLTVWTRWIVVSQHPELAELVIDYRVFGFAALVSMLTGVAFGLAPAWTISNSSLGDAMKSGGRNAGASGGYRLRRAMVVTQMALALVLLAGTGLLIRTAWHLRSTDAGFRPAGLLTAQLSLRGSRYAEPSSQAVFLGLLEERLRAVPEVQAATVSAQLPLLSEPSAVRLEVNGKMSRGQDEPLLMAVNTSGPGYLAAFGIRLLAGRAIDKQDTDTSTQVALINEILARSVWPGENLDAVLGQSIRIGEGPWRVVIGVTSSARQVLTRVPWPEVITPIAQTPQTSVSVALRAAGDPYRITGSLRQAVRELDEGIALSKVQSMEDIQQEYFPRVMTAGIGLFAGVALALAAMGLYGVIAFLVAQRTQEIGVRIALGATRRDIVRMVGGQGLRYVLTGVAIGLAGAFAVARLLAGELFGVSPTDPPVFAGVSVFLIVVALLACLTPALRAARVDPQQALRCD